MLAAREGRRTIVVEVGEQNRLSELFGVSAPEPGSQARLEHNLSTISIDPDQALLEWLQALGGRVSGRLLASSGTFQYFAAAAPGAKELVSMVKIWQLTRGGRRDGAHELVVLDAPATGHALGMLASPRTFGAIARVGPIVGQTRHVQELLQDPARTAYIAVALATEMAVTEALEVQEGLQRELGRELATVIVNALLPRRFTPAEMARIDALEAAVGGAGRGSRVPRDRGARSATAGGGGKGSGNGAPPPELARAAVRAARTVHERSRFQHNQLARLRRRDFDVLGVPFVWGEGLDLEAVRAIAELLGRKL